MFGIGIICFAEFSGTSVGSPRDRSPSVIFGAARRAIPRHNRATPRVGRFVSVAFHPATVSRAMRTARPIRPVGLSAIAQPSSASFWRAASVGGVSRDSCSVRRIRARFLFRRPARSFTLLCGPRLSAPKDMSVAIGARLWTCDRVVRHERPVRRRAMWRGMIVAASRE